MRCFLNRGAVPGLLVAGILVGPSGLGLVDNVGEIGDFAEFGVVLLLFVIAIELKPSRLWLMRRLLFGLGTLQACCGIRIILPAKRLRMMLKGVLRGVSNMYRYPVFA